MCRKYQQDLEALPAPPYPGPKGQEIFETVSKKAWGEWQTIQTMLMNEKKLNAFEPASRVYLADQMEKFLNNEETDRIDGYVAPTE
jgi:Fe-S cluster biosynthesis and repair protein YggX|tara:strand:- start:120 stop:377 length:258 start_codon:yes stop_codon:yes gene_type:complete